MELAEENVTPVIEEDVEEGQIVEAKQVEKAKEFLNLST